MRWFATVAFTVALVALISLSMRGAPAAATLQEDDEAPAATPEPAVVAETDVVTLVAWYNLDLSGDFLILGPLTVGEDFVVIPGEEEAAADIGRIEFGAAEGPLPQITFAGTTFDAYLRYENDPNEGLRWTWYFDDEGARPATLVVQVRGTDGPYQGYDGTATFISREADAGGILILALVPPAAEPAAEPAEEAVEEEPADDADDDEAPAEEPVEEVEDVPEDEDQTEDADA